MTQIGNTSLNGIYHEDAQYPFNLKAGIVRADEGKAVALDPTAANTVKLAEDDDVIIGRLEIVEDRETEGVLVGTVALAGAYQFPAGAVPVIGQYLHGQGSGNVKSSVTASSWLVVEVADDDSYAVAIKV